MRAARVRVDHAAPPGSQQDGPQHAFDCAGRRASMTADVMCSSAPEPGIHSRMKAALSGFGVMRTPSNVDPDHVPRGPDLPRGEEAVEPRPAAQIQHRLPRPQRRDRLGIAAPQPQVRALRHRVYTMRDLFKAKYPGLGATVTL